MQHVFAMANHVTALLNGATDPDPSQHGMTTEEERASSSKPQVSALRTYPQANTLSPWLSVVCACCSTSAQSTLQLTASGRVLPSLGVCMQWPAVQGPVRPQNASLRLYGGAAFERCLDEFQEAAHIVQFPTGKTAAGLCTIVNVKFSSLAVECADL